ncbi:MAG: hypothetical protein GOV15_03390 [Candidatus Diapherotrites archaeon]|nr:hypothetical protein [Candidatus Diapherotrites archaeon]
MIDNEKAQASFTYILMISGAIVLAVVVWYIAIFLSGQQADIVEEQIDDAGTIFDEAKPGGG